MVVLTRQWKGKKSGGVFLARSKPIIYQIKKMKGGFNKSVVIFSAFMLMFCFMASPKVLAKNTSVNAENKVSATANSGGNKIEGTEGSIQTGDAQASAESKIISNGQTSVSVEAKADTGGKSVEATLESNGETGEQKIEKSDDGASVSVAIEADKEKDKSFMESIISTAKSFFNNLISLFS